MTGLIGALDAFGRGGIDDGAPLGPRRILFGLDTAPPPLRSLHVQFARLELALAGTYRNRLCDRTATIATHDLEPGDALFVPAQCWNEPLWDADVRVLSLLFGATHLGLSLLTWDVSRQAFTSVEKRSCLIPGNGPLHHLVEALASLREETVSTALYGRLTVRAVIDYARSLLVNPAPDEERVSSALYRAACVYIDENFDRNISRDGVARQLNISPNYFSRVFSEQGGTTFSDYLATVRINKARMMLEKYDLPLAQISQRCGFHDLNYFFKVFKKRVGRTPMEYRTSVRGRS